ncbi:MAG TPA: GntR family transcriptional regulator [Amycolatopsis sp.]|nr:GntR family transcriptional regulator [Amycolatopsis sp.]
MLRMETVSRVQALAMDVERSIAERQLRPGDRITTLEALRAETGLARQTVSEAARLLVEREIVELRPGRGGGLFVAPVSPVVRLRHTLLSVPKGAATVSDAIAVRDALEELIDTDAARLRTASHIRELRRALGELRRSVTGVDRFMTANWALHEQIARITGNELARGVYLGTLRCVAELSAGARIDESEQQAGYLKHRVRVHTELVEAIIDGDVDRTVAAVARHRGPGGQAEG